MMHGHAWFWMRKRQIKALPAQVGLFQVFRALLEVVPVEEILRPCMSENADHLISKGFGVILCREAKDSDVFEGVAPPNPLRERRRDRPVTMSLPKSPAG